MKAQQFGSTCFDLPCRLAGLPPQTSAIFEPPKVDVLTCCTTGYCLQQGKVPGFISYPEVGVLPFTTSEIDIDGVDPIGGGDPIGGHFLLSHNTSPAGNDAGPGGAGPWPAFIATALLKCTSVFSICNITRTPSPRSQTTCPPWHAAQDASDSRA